MNNAIDIIRAEHRALAAVLMALQAFVDGVAEGKYAVDYALLDAMVRYITEVPDQVHHPKEDAYLFPALRARSPDAAAMLDQLEDEHRRGHDEWQRLEQALATLREAGMAGLPAFQHAVAAYRDFQWNHMALEESKILPLARTALAPEDWAAIDAAFARNDNPWQGPAGKYRELFTRIVNIAPAPIGVGDAGAAR